MSAKCGAKLKAPRIGFCERPPVKGKRRCPIHGGADGSGRPVLHGRDATLERSFGAIWRAARDDQELVRYEADIALALVRERELLLRLEDGDSTTFRQDALALYNGLRQAIREGDEEKIPLLLRELGSHLGEAVDRDGAWEDLQRNVERRARLTEQMVRVATCSHNAVTAKQFLLFVGRIMDEVRLEAGEVVAYRLGQRIAKAVEGDLDPGLFRAALPPTTPGE